MVDFIKTIQVPLEGLLLFLMLFFIVKYFVLKNLKQDDIETKNTKKIFNYVFVIVVLIFGIYCLKFVIMNEIPKSKIENRSYVEDGQSRFEKNCKNILDTTKNK